jgi:hypothetical protein
LTQELIQGLQRAHERALQGGLEGLQTLAPTLRQELRNGQGHGDDTGAAHASYDARAVGPGADGGSELAQARAAAAALNPSQVGAVESVVIDGVMGMIADSPMEYSVYLETERAGQFQELTPVVTSMGPRCTAAVASGMKRAMGG